MTIDQTKEWNAKMTDEERVKKLHEWWQLKQILCAQTLLIPTGTDNWIDRAIRRADHLTECRSHLRKVLRGMTDLVEETTIREFRDFPECTNCTGTGVVHGDSCLCCRGSGKRMLSI